MSLSVVFQLNEIFYYYTFFYPDSVGEHSAMFHFYMQVDSIFQVCSCGMDVENHEFVEGGVKWCYSVVKI